MASTTATSMSTEEADYLKRLRRECSRCGAGPGDPCVDPRGESVRPNGKIVMMHAERRRLKLERRGQPGGFSA